MNAVSKKTLPLVMNVQNLLLKQIKPHPLNPRRAFDESELQSLAASMDDVGLIEPIIVREVKRGCYELVAGERRLRAAALAGWTHIAAMIKALSDAEALTLQLVENLQRVDLNPIEIGRGLEQLCRPVAEGGAGQMQSEAGKLFGKMASWVSVHIGLLSLPQTWQARVAAGELPQAAYKSVVPFADKPAILARIEEDVAANPWSYRTGEDFRNNVKRIAEEAGTTGRWASGTAQQKPTQRPPRPETPQTSGQGAAAEGDTTIEDAAGPDTKQQFIDSVLEAIAAMDDATTLERILFAVRERLETLAAATA